MGSYEHADRPVAAGDRPGAMERFDHELDRLEQLLDELRKAMSSALREGPERAMADTPHPAPESQISGRVDRLRRANERLASLVMDIDL